MAFAFKKVSQFAVTVSAELPSEDPRKPNKGTFVATFKHVDRAGLEALQADLASRELTDAQFLDRYLISVSGIGDAGTEFPADEQRRIVYAEPALTLAVVQAFFAAITGAKRGN